MMELRQLRYFVTVAEELHFSRAAARLNMSQPPLSQQIRRLERDLDVRLFERTNRSVKLTEAGEVLLREVQPLLLGLEKAKTLTQRASRGETSRLSIAFTFSATYTILPEVIRTFRQRYPDVELSLQEMQTVHQLDALFLGEVHIGVIRPPIRDMGIVTQTLHTEALVVALPADHALASRSRLSLKDLAQAPFIMASRNRVGFFYWVKALCREAGFEPRVSQEVTNLYNVVELVSVGLGVALVPEFVKQSPVKNVVYKSLTENPRTELAMAWRGDRSTPVLRAFLALAKELEGIW